MIGRIKESPGGVLISLCEIIIGLLLFFDPVRFTSGIIIALGGLLIVLGVSCLIRYFSAEPAIAAREQNLAKGLFLLGAGVFCVVRHNWFLLTFPALTVLYGAGLMFVGFIKIQRTVDMLRLKRGMWYICAVSAAIALLTSAVILVNPFESAFLVWIFIGTMLIVQAVFDLLSIFLKRKI